MTRVWLTAGACFLLACSPRDTGMAPVRGADVEHGFGNELIPAEWTVAEDTSETGEVRTLSLQLPSASDIGGLLDEEGPRLILRCIGGRIEAFIDTESAPGEAGVPATDSQLVQVQLDSAPACE